MRTAYDTKWQRLENARHAAQQAFNALPEGEQKEAARGQLDAAMLAQQALEAKRRASARRSTP